MKIFKQIVDLQAYLKQKKSRKGKVGFVPTMGALHFGHITLINASKEENEITVCSIFVNPTQFNEASDFEKYPRTVSEDIILLEQNGCDVLFLPSVEEMYEKAPKIQPDLEGLDKKLEGAFRPGHFDGVVQIVYLLINAVHPDRIYMGLKDFQQQAIVKKMIESLKLPVTLRPVETAREANGLARSSRNTRLPAKDREEAGLIYLTMQKAKDSLLKGYSVASVLSDSVKALSVPNTKLEYIKFCDPDTLDELSSFGNRMSGVLLVAIWWGDVRLIDNLLVKRN